MKKSIILFLISLSIATVCFSQTTYPYVLNDSLVVITPLQLKQANLIFVEHRKLFEENTELRLQNMNYERLCYNLETNDSIKNVEIQLLTDNINDCIDKVNKQENQISKLKSSRNLLGGISFSIIGVLLITLLINAF